MGLEITLAVPGRFGALKKKLSTAKILKEELGKNISNIIQGL